MTMTRRRSHSLLVLPFLAVACGGGSKTNVTSGTGTSSSTSAGTTGSGGSKSSTTSAAGGGSTSSTGSGGASAESNSTPVTVNSGPACLGTDDVPFISVTICIPGTTTCQTIDYISVDTGSSGFRVISSVLASDIVLPQPNATTGDPLVECFQFDDGYTWGSVRLADLKIAGEVAAKVPIQLIADPAFPTVPSNCSCGGPAEDTVATFGGNGIIGINQIIPDCGDGCAQAAQPGGYYSCSGGACTPVAVPDADQVPNPIAVFSEDNNGAVLQFPSIPAAGAATLTGSLVFGIGTHANNALGSATVQTVDEYGNFTTVFNGATLDESYIDSGTNLLSFNDNSITQCSCQGLSGFYCPASTLSLSAQNVGLNGVKTTVMFDVESAVTLFDNSSYTAFDDIAGTGSDGTFAWGFPFFLGRRVFVALDGATTPGGKGPYFAY
jgi:hypothetical protein